MMVVLRLGWPKIIQCVTASKRVNSNSLWIDSAQGCGKYLCRHGMNSCSAVHSSFTHIPQLFFFYLTCITSDVCTHCWCFSWSLFCLIRFSAALTGGVDAVTEVKAAGYTLKGSDEWLLWGWRRRLFQTCSSKKGTDACRTGPNVMCNSVDTEATRAWNKSGTADLDSEGDICNGSTVVLENLAWRETHKFKCKTPTKLSVWAVFSHQAAASQSATRTFVKTEQVYA